MSKHMKFLGSFSLLVILMTYSHTLLAKDNPRSPEKVAMAIDCDGRDHEFLEVEPKKSSSLVQINSLDTFSTQSIVPNPPSDSAESTTLHRERRSSYLDDDIKREKEKNKSNKKVLRDKGKKEIEEYKKVLRDKQKRKSQIYPDTRIETGRPSTTVTDRCSPDVPEGDETFCSRSLICLTSLGNTDWFFRILTRSPTAK